MLCNRFRSRRIFVVGLVAAGVLLGAPRPTWAQG
jgi:hypothetical protein